jgi:hypothetical protein
MILIKKLPKLSGSFAGGKRNAFIGAKGTKICPELGLLRTWGAEGDLRAPKRCT